MSPRARLQSQRTNYSRMMTSSTHIQQTLTGEVEAVSQRALLSLPWPSSPLHSATAGTFTPEKNHSDLLGMAPLPVALRGSLFFLFGGWFCCSPCHRTRGTSLSPDNLEDTLRQTCLGLKCQQEMGSPVSRASFSLNSDSA